MSFVLLCFLYPLRGNILFITYDRNRSWKSQKWSGKSLEFSHPKSVGTLYIYMFKRGQSLVPYLLMPWLMASSAYTSHSINTLRPRQNGHHFADDPFKHIFLNETPRITIKIWSSFLRVKLIILGLVQITDGADQATSHCLEQWWLDYWCI